MAKGKDPGGDSPGLIESTSSAGFSQSQVTAKAAVIERHIGGLIASALGFALAGEPTDEFRVTLRVERVNG